MEKRVLLAVVLSFVVLYGYQALFPPEKPRVQQPAVERATPQPASGGATSPPAAPARPVAEAAAPPTAAPVASDGLEREVVVENDAVRAVFTTRGAALKSWTLKRYRDGSGAPLDLVPQRVPGAPRPFTLTTDDPAVTAALANGIYQSTAATSDAGPHPSAPQKIGLEYSDASGLSVRKEFTFSPRQPYAVSVTASVTKDGAPLNPAIQWGPALGTGVVERSGTYNPPPQPILFRDGSVTRVKTTKIQDYAVQEGTFGFVGVDDHYFLSAALPGGQPIHVEFQPVSVPVPGSEHPATFVSWSVRYVKPPTDAQFFFGPKDFDVLVSVNRDLVRAIDFGMFGFLVVPLLRALKWINVYLGNYGWSIVALTVFINLAMFPLRHKTVVSMRKLQDLAPEQKAIQDRYAKMKMSDPERQKMNVELMNLYRERGVNPASGCVPMLLTFPVLLAFYSMLSVAIELRGAPFIWWIKDLSIHDPYFVTPIVTGVTQFIQTRMTPTTGGDPVQQKMMMFMPLIFMTMFIWAPSGLVLYWLVSNVWAIGQQALTNRLIGPAPPRAIRPPAERQLKNAGAGRTPQAAKERK